MSGDPESDYFADGMAEEIITALSRCSGILVIALNSSFNYKGRAVDVRQVRRELGVGYVLEGSVRRSELAAPAGPSGHCLLTEQQLRLRGDDAMPNHDLQPGTVFHRTIIVEETFTGLALSQSIVGLSDMPPVLSTAFMVGLIECTCIDGLSPYLLEGENTVGTLIDVSHVSSTPIGMRVTAEARLVAVVGRKLRFLVTCHDEREIIGKGNHERTLIRPASFMRRAEGKRMAAV